MNRPKAKPLSLLLMLAIPLGGGCAHTADPVPAAPAAATPAVPAGLVASPVAASTHPEPDPTLAVINGEPISREEVIEPLLQANGLNFLLLTVQLKVARQEAAKRGIVLKPEDIEAERSMTMKGLFPDADQKDYDALIDQLLAKQGISRSQFEMIIETNAALRKIAEPMCAGKVTEDNIKQAFDLKYGAKVQIRDIKVTDLASAQRVKQMLAAGKAFDDVARMMSADLQTRANGGLWPPFGAATQGISQLIKDQAWGLKEGDVSDVIETDGAYHIIKVEKRIAPPAKVVTLDKETHDYLQKELTEKYVQQEIKLLRAEISRQVVQQGVLEIRDPGLKAQFDRQLAEAKRQEEEQQKSNMTNMLNRLRPSATRPTTAPTPTPGTEARDRPPATKSGE